MEPPALPLHVKEFIAGFFDGDGIVGLYVKMTGVRPRPTVCLDQSRRKGEPEELAFIRDKCGGVLRLTSRKGTDVAKPQWRLWFRDPHQACQVLRIVAVHGILKSPQATLALKHEVEGLHDLEYVDRLKVMKKDMKEIPIDPARLTFAYLAGLFAADGSVGVYRTKMSGEYAMFAHISKSQCPRLLHAIRDKLGEGSITQETKLLLSKMSAVRFLHAIRPYLVGSKVIQAELAVRADDWEGRGATRKKRTPEEKERLDKTIEELKKLKKE